MHTIHSLGDLPFSQIALDILSFFCDTPAPTFPKLPGGGSPAKTLQVTSQRVAVMVAKIARIAVAGLMLVLLAAVRPAQCDGWSLPNPFASDKGKTETKAKAKKSVLKPAKKPPSTLDKIGTGTKNFFTGVGNTLTGKKAEPKKASSKPYANSQSPGSKTQKKDESKSWFGSLFKSEEPKPAKSIDGFMSLPRSDI